MSSVGKIIGALVHGSQEATLALAQLNFDFSLVKLEAPPEFRGLGAALTKKRREVAEDGTSHITARKLGALFKDILPPTPNLIRQYGTRASEIAENRAVNPPASSADGIFADHVGIDGTSIWAAATSGEGAIAVHLLACMLARMFPAPEAISIWYELVENRKSQIIASAEHEPLHFATLAAAKVSLSRDQLAEWDISARSWLRSADEAKRAQQKQLMLIVRNINIPVHSGDKGTYESVIGAWKTALTLMERLLNGEPQSVQGGDLLLGVASWHIYPNLCIFGDRNVRQNDPLVPEAGVLSIGIERSLAQVDTGPVWSLPLSHFRYYGAPYTATRFMCDDSERLSLDEFLLVSLGSLLGSWDRESTQTLRLARIVAQIGSQLSSAPQPSQQTLWIRLLGQAADRLLYSSDEDRRMYQRLVSLGKRRARHLLQDIPTVFGLNNISIFLGKMDNTENKLELTRRVALRLAKDKHVGPKDMFVVYRFRRLGNDPLEWRGRQAPWNSQFVYTTVVAQQEDSLKRDSTGQPVSRERHARWIYYSNAEQKRLGEEYFANLKQSLPSPRGMAPDDLGLQLATFLEDDPSIQWVPHGRFLTSGASTGQILDEAESAFRQAHGSQESTMFPEYDSASELQPQDFIFVTGINGECGVYVNPDLSDRFPDPKSNLDVATLDDVEWALSNHVFPLKSLVDTFGCASGIGLMVTQSIRAFAAVVETYSDLANSTMALKATYRPFSYLKWAKAFQSSGIDNESDDKWARALNWGGTDYELNFNWSTAFFPSGTDNEGSGEYLDSSNVPCPFSQHDLDGNTIPFSLSRELRFALLVYMETGQVDVDPQTFDRVVAMCSGDFIFVSAPILLDPVESTTSSSDRMRCVRGNIGRAGIALLTTPEDPLMKSSHEANWKVIGHEPFNGELLDSFKGTSLQLGFTNFKLPIDTGNLGAYDMDLVFMEAIIRVNDHDGNWIGDLNILRAMENWTRVNLPIDCPHTGDDRAVKNIPSATAIDNWDEFLDEPDGAMVFRARENWIARLSAAGFGGQQGERLVVIVPHCADVCWSCFYKSVDEKDWSRLLLIC